MAAAIEGARAPDCTCACEGAGVAFEKAAAVSVSTLDEAAEPASADPAGEPIVKTTSEHFKVEHFPMLCMAMQNFMQMGKMTSYGELLQAGLLKKPGEDETIHFISHEWLGDKHPDSHSVQLHRMQEVFRKVADGQGSELFEPKMWETFRSGAAVGTLHASLGRQEKAFQAAELTTAMFAQHVRCGVVWIDFASIPQLCDVTDESRLAKQRDDQLAAVRSLSAYVERADYFWILAPAAQHLEKRERRDFSTYRTRTWCRFEECANIMSTRVMMPLVVTESPRLTSYAALEFLWYFAGRPDLGPCQGVAMCCQVRHMVTVNGQTHSIACDTHRISQLLREMYRNKMDGLIQAEHWFMVLAFTAFAPTVLARHPNERPGIRTESAEHLRHWLEDPRLESVKSSGITPLHIAAVLNDVDATKALLAAKRYQNPLERTMLGDTPFDFCSMVGAVELAQTLLVSGAASIEDVTRFNSELGVQMLHRAAGYGQAAMVQWLLSCRADVDSPKAPGSAYAGHTALHSAAQRGHAKCCEILLQHRADVCVRDAAGSMPLHCATTHSLHVTGSPEADATGKVFHLLVAARGDPSAQDVAGWTALDLAAACGVSLSS